MNEFGNDLSDQTLPSKGIALNLQPTAIALGDSAPPVGRRACVLTSCRRPNQAPAGAKFTAETGSAAKFTSRASGIGPEGYGRGDSGRVGLSERPQIGEPAVNQR